jgi:hypothetical protein
MVQGLFFNGVKRDGCYSPIKGDKSLAVFIAPQPAGTKVPAFNGTATRAKGTPDIFTGEWVFWLRNV